MVILAAIPMLMLTFEPLGANGQRVLQCTRPNTPGSLESFLIEPNTPGEAARLRQAPHGASRLRKHILQVHWQSGAHQFKDVAPYMQGDMDGLYWTYCGYDSEAGVHVIQKNGSDLLTGLLVDEKTGSILPGGFSVVFSPDSRQYITYEQEEGAELHNVKLYTRAGKLLWSGHNGLLSADGQTVTAEFLRIYWDASGKLLAEFKEDGGRKQTLTLAMNAKGEWSWR